MYVSCRLPAFAVILLQNVVLAIAPPTAMPKPNAANMVSPEGRPVRWVSVARSLGMMYILWVRRRG